LRALGAQPRPQEMKEGRSSRCTVASGFKNEAFDRALSTAPRGPPFSTFNLLTVGLGDFVAEKDATDLTIFLNIALHFVDGAEVSR
jgi:hypothetical protein